MGTLNKCLGCYNSIEKNEPLYHQKCSVALFETKTPPQLEYSFNDIESLAVEEINRHITIPGVQPKLSLGKEGRGRDQRLTITNLWGTYVFKPPVSDYSQLPENEDLTMHLARVCNIQTAKHGLIPLQSGELAYISKRFDRVGYKGRITKLHMEDLCQLTETAAVDKYRLSTEKMAKVIQKYSTYKGSDSLRFFEVLLFCFLTGNADMHLKNFSLYSSEGVITLSPAYDLVNTKILIKEDNEELALPISGKKSKFKRVHFEDFAKDILGIDEKVVGSTIDGLLGKADAMKEMTKKSFLNEENKKNYGDLLGRHSDRIS